MTFPSGFWSQGFGVRGTHDPRTADLGGQVRATLASRSSAGQRDNADRRRGPSHRGHGLNSAIQMLPVRSPMLKRILSRPTASETSVWFAMEIRALWE
jgi:hypothetical protein